MKEFFGIFAALIVFASYPIYGVRIWQRKITPNLVSWIIFVTLSFAIALSSFASGGRTNSWVTIGPLLGTTSILIIAIFRSKVISVNGFDLVCLILGTFSIVLWYFTRQSKELAQYALYLSLLADFIGILPTAKFLYKNPEKDRPAMWIIFSLGYLFSMFAITENTFSNWVLPAFMFFAPALVWIPLLQYRIKNKIPLCEWI